VGKLRLLADEASDGQAEDARDTPEGDDPSAVLAATAKIALLPFLVWAALCWAWRTGSAVCGVIAEAVDKSGEVVQESAQTYDDIDIGDSEDEFDVAPGRRRPAVEQREAPAQEELQQQADDVDDAPASRPPAAKEPADPSQTWHEVAEDTVHVLEQNAPPKAWPIAREPQRDAATSAASAAVENGVAPTVWPDAALAVGDAAAAEGEAVGSSDTDEEQYQGAVRVAEEVLRDTAGASVTFEASQQDLQGSLHEQVADMGSPSDQAGVEHHPAESEDGTDWILDTAAVEQEEDVVVENGTAAEVEQEEDPVVEDGTAAEVDQEEDPVVEDGTAAEVEQEEDAVVEDGAAASPPQEPIATAVDEPEDTETTAAATENHTNGAQEPEAAQGGERTQDREPGEIPVSPATGSVVGVWEYNELEDSSDRSGCQSTPALPRASPRAPDAVVRSGPGTIRSATGSSVSWADMSEEDGDADASSLVSGHLLPPKQGKHRKVAPARKNDVWKPSLRTCAQ